MSILPASLLSCADADAAPAATAAATTKTAKPPDSTRHEDELPFMVSADPSNARGGGLRD